MIRKSFLALFFAIFAFNGSSNAMQFDIGDFDLDLSLSGITKSLALAGKETTLRAFNRLVNRDRTGTARSVVDTTTDLLKIPFTSTVSFFENGLEIVIRIDRGVVFNSKKDFLAFAGNLVKMYFAQLSKNTFVSSVSTSSAFLRAITFRVIISQGMAFVKKFTLN